MSLVFSKNFIRLLVMPCILLGTLTSVSFSRVSINKEGRYLRFSMKSKEQGLKIKQSKSLIELSFEDDDLFLLVFDQLQKDDHLKKYIKNIRKIAGTQVAIDLKNSTTEVFSFYDSKLNTYHLDFWSNEKKKKKLKQVKVNKPVKRVLTELDKVSNVLKVKKQKPSNSEQKEIKELINVSKRTNKDFRYGASFVWKYDAELPFIKIPLEVSSKTVEHYYPIKRFSKVVDEESSKVQIAIDFYKNNKFGFMNKALSEVRSNKYLDIKNYMIANTLIKRYQIEGKQEYLGSAFSMLNEIATKTEKYDLKAGIYQYKMYFYLNANNVVATLENAKELYGISSYNFDEDLVKKSSMVILDSLAKLGQKDKISKFLDDSIVKKFLGSQIGISYKIYTDVKNKKYDEAISFYEKNTKGLQKPIEESLLFNIGESYFQVAEYKKSKDIYKDYVKNYSFHKNSAFARNRIALNYDLLDYSPSIIEKAYLNAIDLSNNAKARYEAKLRYIGYKYLRDLKKKEDTSVLALMNYSKDEELSITNNIQRLLWLVRLRTYLVQENYDEALAYYEILPIDKMNYFEKMTFEKDYHEIIVGRVKSQYESKKYTNVIKTYEANKDLVSKYDERDFAINYYLSLSYLNLGFVKKFISTLDKQKKLQTKSLIKEYPVWVKRNDLSLSYESLMAQKFSLEKDWKNLISFYQKLSSDKKNKLISYYLKSLINEKEYDSYISLVEEKLMNGGFNALSEKNYLDLIVDYTLSIQKAQPEKLEKKVIAILSDERVKNNYKLSERLNYVLLEKLSENKLKNNDKISRVWNFLKKSFPKSKYLSRAKFIYGTTLIEINQKKEGTNVLREIASDNQSPEYLKKLAKTEIKSLEVYKSI